LGAITDHVMESQLFCHHDHHHSYPVFDQERDDYGYRHLLGYAEADLVTAAGTHPQVDLMTDEGVAKYWPMIRMTGYGRAVDLGCQALFGLSFGAENADALTEVLQATIRGKDTATVFDHYVHSLAKNKWTIHDRRFWIDQLGTESTYDDGMYPDSYRFVVRMDSLLDIVDAVVAAVDAAIDRCLATGQLAGIKIGMAYQRDLAVGDPTRHEAELAFNRIRSRKVFWDGIQQNTGAVDAKAGRALGDYMFHKLIQRAADDDLPVQIHTGYLAGNWGSLSGTRSMLLIPIFDKYRNVRFDLFHATWPWTSELGTIAKNYPNVWADM